MEDIEIINKLIETIATHIGKKRGCKKVKLTFLEKGGGQNHYMGGFKYHMKEGVEPLRSHERMELTKEIVSMIKHLSNYTFTTLSTSSISHDGEENPW